MCGIAGFYGFRDDSLIKKFSSELVHRGPDGEGFYIDDTVSLLNRRLAIIDLKTGDQPIYNEDKSLVVVYNGEIYNYRELKKTLEKKGHIFQTASDTEVIVHGYEEWGEDCFDKLNGMFAIALYDKKKKKLLLLRDHFGVKPLYYFTNGNSLFFSSEIKPLFYSQRIKKRPNDRIIYRYLRFRIHDDSEDTFFKGIYKLMPGEILVVDKTGVKKKQFTRLREILLEESIKNNNTQTKNIQKNRFQELLIESVRSRLISDVPVGTCLSGGLDSSTIVSFSNTLLKEKVTEARSIGKIQKTFSAIFPNSINDEEQYIDDLIKKIRNIRSYKIYPKPEIFFEELDDFVRTQEEPVISTGPYAQYKVMQEARNHVKVVLDGQGADEMLAGYDPYYFVYFRQLLRQGNFFTFLKECISSFDIVMKYLQKKTGVNIQKILNEEFAENFQFETFDITKENLKQRLLEDIFFNSLPSLLRYEDRNSMRFSIEGRVPFLDVNLISYIFQLPDEEIIKNGWNKVILRQTVRHDVPNSIVQRRNKIGFTTPELEWFIRMKNRIFEIFMSKSFEKRKYFNQKAVLQSFQELLEGKNDDTLLFWRLLNVELWLRVFFDPPSRKASEGQAKKKLTITVGKKTYTRHLIRTNLFEKGDNYMKKITSYILQLNNKLESKKEWFVAVSEKIIAVAQGRSYFIWDIKPGFWARFLSRHVKKTPYGIGLGSPETMQLAIQEAGLGKIILAAATSALTKPLGFRGVFYHIAGRDIAAIDGPTEYSVYPSNVSAKLAPENPQKVTEELKTRIFRNIKDKNFLGVVIIDANDLGQNILGNSTEIDDDIVEKIFSDNPMGQGTEQTPLAIVVCPK